MALKRVILLSPTALALFGSVLQADLAVGEVIDGALISVAHSGGGFDGFGFSPAGDNPIAGVMNSAVNWVDKSIYVPLNLRITAPRTVYLRNVNDVTIFIFIS